LEKKSSKLTKQKIALYSKSQPSGNRHNRSRQFLAISPNGEKHVMVGIRDFSKKYKIAPNQIRRLLKLGQPVMRGKHKGWQFLNEDVQTHASNTLTS
jgi:hypothetical protein